LPLPRMQRKSIDSASPTSLLGSPSIILRYHLIAALPSILAQPRKTNHDGILEKFNQ
jgi:hypothetical protein